MLSMFSLISCLVRLACLELPIYICCKDFHGQTSLSQLQRCYGASVNYSGHLLRRSRSVEFHACEIRRVQLRVYMRYPEPMQFL